MKSRTLAAFVAARRVAGCTVGPDYVRPDVDTPAAWRIDYPKAAEVANTKWWEQFGDPVLNGLIETALRENRDVRIAAARVDQFLGALTSTQSQSLPQLGYGADVSRTRASRVSQPPLPPGADPYFALYQGTLRRLVADRPLRPRAAPERGRPGPGLRKRAGAARRRAHRGDRCRDQLRQPARASTASSRSPSRPPRTSAKPCGSSGCATSTASSRSPKSRRSNRNTSRRRPPFPRLASRSPRRRTCCRSCSDATRGRSRAARRSTSWSRR